MRTIQLPKMIETEDKALAATLLAEGISLDRLIMNAYGRFQYHFTNSKSTRVLISDFYRGACIGDARRIINELNNLDNMIESELFFAFYKDESDEEDEDGSKISGGLLQ